VRAADDAPAPPREAVEAGEPDGEARHMKAGMVTGAGAPEAVMELGERPLPAPGPGEIRVRVLAAGLGLPDAMMCRGRYEFEPSLPFTPGQEAVGIVTEAAGSADFELGQRVMGPTAFYRGSGGFAEEALLVADASFEAPPDMPDVEAAVFNIPFRTAWCALVARGGLSPSETLLVHGAAGGSGFAAVQLGKALGARVIAVARGAERCRACRDGGADDVVDTESDDFAEAVATLTGGRGVDAVFDPVGGDVFRRSLGLLAYGGRLLAIGFASGEWADASTRGLVWSNASVLGVMAVLHLYGAGRIRPQVAGTLAFGRVPQGLAELEARRVAGKLVMSAPEER
jgi:NADPH2:quinone reductase